MPRTIYHTATAEKRRLCRNLLELVELATEFGSEEAMKLVLRWSKSSDEYAPAVSTSHRQLRDARMRQEYQWLQMSGLSPGEICGQLARKYGLSVSQVRNVVCGYGIGVQSKEARARWQEKRRARAALDSRLLQLVQEHPEVLIYFS